MCVKGVVMSVNPITSFKANRPSSVVRNDSVVNKEDDLKKSKEGKNIKTGVALTSALGGSICRRGTCRWSGIRR